MEKSKKLFGGADGGEGLPIGIILSTSQLMDPVDREEKRRAEQQMNSREIFPEAKFPFVGSDEILNSVFDGIDRQVFNANLDGIKLEWCDKLKSRAVIAYERSTYSTKQTYIRCSKTWFKNRNRKQFVEAILYELIQLYVQKSKSAAEHEENPHLVVYLLEAAMYYFNERFETNLILNNNYKPDSDDTDVQEILASIANERANERMGLNAGLKMAPNVKLLTKKVAGNKDVVKCSEGCGSFCYGNGCRSAAALRERFYGANIYFIFALDGLQCFLCEKEISGGTLGAHFNKDCKVFGQPKQTAGH